MPPSPTGIAETPFLGCNGAAYGTRTLSFSSSERVARNPRNAAPEAPAASAVNGTAVAVVAGSPGPLLYAFTLGLIAAVNPCGFPLLPAYLSFFVGDATDTRQRRSLRGLWAGASVTAGFLLVFGLCGILVESGVNVLLGWVPWVMLPIGAAMAGVGVAAALGHPLKLTVPVRRRSASRGPLAMASFGVAYAVASLTCALPLFLAAVAGSFGRLGVTRGVGTTVAYALGMGLFLMVAGLLVANVGVAPLRRIGRVSGAVPRIGGAVLALVGTYLVFYWAADLIDPTAFPEPIGLVEHVQSAISTWLSGSPRVIGVVLGLVLLVVLGLAAAGWSRRPARPGDPAGQTSRPGSPSPDEVVVGG